MFCFRTKSGKVTLVKIKNIENDSAEELPIKIAPRRDAYASVPIQANESLELRTYPKSASDEESMRKALKDNEFLNNMLSEETIALIIDAMELKTVGANEVIIKQGENGNAIYISSKGSFEVLINKKQYSKFNDIRVFGELALMFEKKRLSTIKSLTGGAVWHLNRNIFFTILARNNISKDQERFNFLQTVEKLKDIQPATLRIVANLLKDEFFKTGATIIREGDSGDLFYVIKAGSVTVLKESEGFVNKLSKGDCFGELALQNEDIRQASVTANAPGVQCLTLNRIDFQNYFGNIKITEIHVEKLKSINETQPEYMDIRLSDLVIIGAMGKGGFATVSLARVKKKKHLVFALKRMTKIDILLEEKQQHAINERYIHLNSISPFVVRLYRTYRSKKYVYFLMEPCLGGDLFNLLDQQKNRKFQRDDAQFIIASVLEALFYLHSRGIVHRDLKPENVFIANNGYFKLGDFGCAKKLDPTGGKTNSCVGTPEYTSPEVILVRGHDKAVDYWAIGVLIYELLAGKTPFRSNTALRIYQKVLRGINSTNFPVDFDVDAKKLIMKFCILNPWDRMGMSRDAIERIRNDKWFKGN
ncbi:unnamed protein product [Ceutorhynchus assimilis]|uniref:cGMP-dependent protein kinase n=1 Tax=Ceutorhynchus assimilis TaxID=467358 RepID=A0A9P0DE98_9CUCU|nr:unnamed protein product [Ceutorhynchus assimilis]